jgi:hypothetical protein
MKKSMVLLCVIFFTVVFIAFAAETPKPELRPLQKLMQARLGWMTAMQKNLEAKKFEAIGKDADALAAQTQKVGEGLPNPLAKELTLAVSSLAKGVSASALKKDGDTVKAKLGEIMGKCNECHAKIRDKK